MNEVTLITIKARVAALEKSVRDDYDPESHHSDEDEIRHIVLQAIAAGHPRAKELAIEALRTSALEFERWYA